MVFNSLEFLLLVILTLVIYYLPSCYAYQKLILIVASFIFYAWTFPWLLLLLVFSIVINTVTSYYTIRYDGPKDKVFATVGVILNLSVLLFFKYSPLLGKSIFSGSGTIGNFLVSIPLPIGISFFTFQGISLLVDTYKSKKSPKQIHPPYVSFREHFENTALFKAFFPQLVSGPIVKAHDFYPQIQVKYFKVIHWELVFKYVLTGYFLKMVVADNLKDFTFELAYPYFTRLSTIYLVSILFAYSMQIFADFAGYSLIAIGISGLFGYKIMHNFNFPYIASSFSDFWKRWHISLSTFLKEYLYFPLGGNRKGRIRTYLNLFIVMALGGLWHGAAWSYMIWGIAHGLFLSIERLLNDFGIKIQNQAWKIAKTFLVFIMVSLAWLLFKLPEFDHVILFFQSVYNNTHVYTDFLPLLYIFIYSLPIVLYHGWYLLRQRYQLGSSIVVPISLALMLFLLLFNSGSPQDFIYFQF